MHHRMAGLPDPSPLNASSTSQSLCPSKMPSSHSKYSWGEGGGAIRHPAEKDCRGQGCRKGERRQRVREEKRSL